MRTIIVATIITVALTLIGGTALAEQQTRFYGPDGRSIGTAVPLGESSARFYDERGHLLGTSTPTDGMTRFYDERGRPTGWFQFDGRMRRAR
jgi:YD repeat-containing protein